ncbi:MAG: hypothetical protein JSV52_06565 [Candidatus Zixiibacteriota bacterium]|nr:MAG: hypothetical protein JSV52_06565 [candidate division Zixibacteria bacterium]
MFKVFAYGGLLVGLALVFASGCNNNNSGTNAPNLPNEPSYYSTELEPSLSTDREYIYYITSDTLLADKNGIYRARVTSPAREEILYGFGFHSPVQFPDGSGVAFLTGGTLNVLDFASGSVSTAGVTGNYHAIAFLDDSLLIGCVGKLLYLINIENPGVSQLDVNGSDPTYYSADRVITLSERDNGVWDVCRLRYFDIEEGPEITVDTLVTITSEGKVRWLSMEPTLNRYVYVEQRDDANLVFTGQVGTQTKNFIAQTGHVKPYLLDFNQLIYQGPDGRFYESDFDGSYHAPFWSTEDDQ